MERAKNVVGIDPGSQTSHGKSLVIRPSSRKHRCPYLIRSIQTANLIQQVAYDVHTP